MSIRPEQAHPDVKSWYHPSYSHSPQSRTGIPNGQRTWAVVIGINEYKDRPLTFARTDALYFNDYLVGNDVPQDHITLLLDNGFTRKFLDGTELEAKAATREGILEALYGLSREEIHENDTIVIYYAGHGSSYPAVECWRNARTSIEAIAPIDRGGHPFVPDISNREIDLILRYLSQNQGSNITAIFDCSFASSSLDSVLSELSKEEVGTMRGTTAVGGESGLSDMLLKAEEMARKYDAWKPEEALVPPDAWKAPISSRVWIAACQLGENAWEISKLNGGVFTTALLNVLEKCSLQSTSYENLRDLIQRSIEENQHQQIPYIEGSNKGCLVFQIPCRAEMLNKEEQKRRKRSFGDSHNKRQKIEPLSERQGLQWK